MGFSYDTDGWRTAVVGSLAATAMPAGRERQYVQRRQLDDRVLRGRIVTVLTRRFHSRAVLELENLAPVIGLHILRRRRPGRLRLITIDLSLLSRNRM